MASTVTKQCSCSHEGVEDLSADMEFSAAQLNTQLEPPMADKKRSEEREIVVHSETDVKQVMVLETELFEQKGSLVLQRLLVTGCFICKRRGHLAKDCPDAKTQMLQAQSGELCLKCGDSGHDMFTCKVGYSSSDLEKIQCWVCKAFGHLLCIDYKNYGPKQVSCYNCGKLGHLGPDCLNLNWNIQLASRSCKTGGTGPSCGEGNDGADNTLQEGKDGDRDLLCEDRKSVKVQDLLQKMERSDVLGSEVASKKIRRSRWRKRKRRQRKTARIAENGRWENGGQCGMRQECQSSEEPKSNVLLKPEAM